MSIDAEIQQRAVEYFTLSKKGVVLMDILAEMAKFPERESSLIKKAEDTKADTAKLSAIRSRAQQKASNALMVHQQHVTHTNGITGEVELQNTDILGDLLSPLAIEGLPGVSGTETISEDVVLALAPVGEQENAIKPILDIAERFHALCVNDSGVLYEDPYVQIGIKAVWRGHQGRVVLFLGNKTTSSLDAVQAVILPPSHMKLVLSSVPEIIPPRSQVAGSMPA